MLDGDARAVYLRILDLATEFLTQGMKWKVELLSDYNPTFEDVAKLIDSSRVLVQDALHAHDAHLADQAVEYCYIMGKIGIAIREEDQAALDHWCGMLYKKPFAMP